MSRSAWSGRSTSPWGCRGSRNSGPGWRATSPRSPAIARTDYDELPEPLRRRIAHDWGRSFDEWGYER